MSQTVSSVTYLLTNIHIFLVFLLLKRDFEEDYKREHYYHYFEMIVIKKLYYTALSVIRKFLLLLYKGSSNSLGI